MPDHNANHKTWQKIVAKAWNDEGYKARLLAAPKSVLLAEGLELPQGIEVKIVEATEKQVWFVLPAQTSEAVIAGEERLAAAIFS